MYRVLRSCTVSAAASTTSIAMSVTAGPRPTFTARKSANVSPTVVERILMTQNVAVISGTLVCQSRWRGGAVGSAVLVLTGSSCGSAYGTRSRLVVGPTLRPER